MNVEEAIDILELRGKEINPENIRKAFIRLSKKYHPDATGRKDDTMFKLINEAYSLLRANPDYGKRFWELSEEEIRIMLDNLVLEIVEQFDIEIYRNIVIPELRRWLEGGEPLLSLQRIIERRINLIKPRLVNIVKAKFDKFSENIGAKLDSSFYHVSNSFDAKYLSGFVGEMITNVIGYVTAAVVAMASGGSGMALIATGPLGLILGAGLGFYLFKKNKKDIKKAVENYIMREGLPQVVKSFVADTVINKAVEGEEKFIRDLSARLKEDLAPIYKQIKLIYN